jgi:predicted CXXCH cytochrome family protein
MGDGKSPTGTGATPKPFDDGTFGFNVNGHGANGTAARAPLRSLTPNARCTDCHDVNSPPGTHYNCVNEVNAELNTKRWPGKLEDTRNANTAHLVAGYLPEAPGAKERQIAFDDYCATACHKDQGVEDMRHGSHPGGKYDKVMEFNIANSTTDDPKRSRGLDPKLVPWTIDDLTTAADAHPPQVRFYGVCVSCHDPHGTATQQKTRGTNKMVVRSWKGEGMQSFCGTVCHTMP